VLLILFVESVVNISLHQLLKSENLYCYTNILFNMYYYYTYHDQSYICIAGGTVDVTVHEVLADDNLREIHLATGGAWGGTNVDEAYRQLVMKIVGGDVLFRFTRDFAGDRLEFDRDFEMKKRVISQETHGRVKFWHPVALSDVCKEMIDQTPAELLKQTHYSNTLKIERDGMYLSADLVRSLFDASIESIVSHIRELLEIHEVESISTIIMVGGFSEAPLVKDAIRSNFPGKTVIIPDDGGLAVLKGPYCRVTALTSYALVIVGLLTE
jgi:hypothetical protein